MTKSELKDYIKECISEYNLDKQYRLAIAEVNNFNSYIDEDILTESSIAIIEKIKNAIEKIIQKLKKLITETIPNVIKKIEIKLVDHDTPIMLPELTVYRADGKVEHFKDAFDSIDYFKNILDRFTEAIELVNNPIDRYEFNYDKKSVHKKKDLDLKLNNLLHFLKGNVKQMEKCIEELDKGNENIPEDREHYQSIIYAETKLISMYTTLISLCIPDSNEAEDK